MRGCQSTACQVINLCIPADEGRCLIPGRFHARDRNNFCNWSFVMNAKESRCWPMPFCASPHGVRNLQDTVRWVVAMVESKTTESRSRTTFPDVLDWLICDNFWAHYAESTRSGCGRIDPADRLELTSPKSTRVIALNMVTKTVAPSRPRKARANETWKKEETHSDLWCLW